MKTVTAAKEAKTPATPVTPMEQLLGVTLLRSVGATPEPTTELLKNKQLVALLFAAGDDKDCVILTARLKDFYRTASSSVLEVVYVSSDQKLKEFEVFFGGMPWLSLGTTDDVRAVKTMLAKTLAISAIPTVIIMDVMTGQLVADDCVQRLTGANENVQSEADRALLNEWKSAKPRDVHTAVQERVRSDLTPRNFIKTTLRNVVIMFLLLQLGTVAMRKAKILLHGSGSPPRRTVSQKIPFETIIHTEF